MTQVTRYIAGQVFASSSLEWLPALILFVFIFPGFALLAGLAIYNERQAEAREIAEFDRMVLSLLKFSLATASVDRARPLADIVIALTLRSGRPQLLYQRRSPATDLRKSGRKLTTFVYAYHYVRNPLFQQGGVFAEGMRTERRIRKFVFEQKWHFPVFLAREDEPA